MGWGRGCAQFWPLPDYYPLVLVGLGLDVGEGLGLGCHGPAGVPWLATRCLCVLSTWLVVCLVPCAPMSIVCPLPSCYLIIVSVAPAVSPSLPSFVSLYSLLMSAILGWSVVFHVSCVTWVFHVWLCPSLLPACLLVFPLRGGFCSLFCLTLLLKDLSSAFESSTPSLSWQNGSATWGLSRGGNRQPWVQGVRFPTSTRETWPLRFMPGTSWKWLASRLRRRPASWCFFGEA